MARNCLLDKRLFSRGLLGANGLKQNRIRLFRPIIFIISLSTNPLSPMNMGDTGINTFADLSEVLAILGKSRRIQDPRL